ncbi:hypothetical protein [Sphingobium aromaticiconvertens]|uniref:hypothetical protein n=1 Tax=Sphingobium aromaticiconvertens TaxID=365341 RepID=UPI003015CF5D
MILLLSCAHLAGNYQPSKELNDVGFIPDDILQNLRGTQLCFKGALASGSFGTSDL